jgi:hypothetical protein
MVYPRAEVGAGQIGRFIQSAAWREVVLISTYNGRMGGEGERILVPVPMHVDQLTELNYLLKCPDLKKSISLLYPPQTTKKTLLRVG